MGKVAFDISMSLDGFIAGANVRLEAGLGDGGERLHDWGFNSADPRNHAIVAAWASTGAIIVGRNTYDLSIPHWGADGPTGPARVPTIILSHSVPTDLPDGHVYTFVDDLDTALARAQTAAGDSDIGIQGANVAAQFIARGLVDEIFIHMVPVLFGSGVRLFDQPGSEHVWLETVEVIHTPEAVHLRFRPAK